MISQDVQRAAETWLSMADVITVPHTEAEYDRLMTILHQILDEVGIEEPHPLDPLLELVGILIDNYETEHFPELEEHFPR